MGFNNEFSYYLFARPSFWEGFSRTLDLAGDFDSYNQNVSGEVADAKAMLQDWSVVGLDIQDAADEYGQEIKRKTVA